VLSKHKDTRNSKKRLDPTIVVAWIGLFGTIVAGLLASPLAERWISRPTPDPGTATIPPRSTDTPPPIGNRIRLNQTVTGRLYYDEAGEWIFSDGPATIIIVLDVVPSEPL